MENYNEFAYDDASVASTEEVTAAAPAEEAAAPVTSEVPVSEAAPISEAASAPDAAPGYTAASAPEAGTGYGYRAAGSGYQGNPYNGNRGGFYQPYSGTQHTYQPRYQAQPSYTGRPPYQEAPQYHSYEKKKQEKPRKEHSVLRTMVASLLTLALVVTGCMVTAATVNKNWEHKNQETINQLTSKIDALQSQINNVRHDGGSTVSTSPVANIGLTPSDVYDRNVDSVVAVSSTIRTSRGQGIGTGSGFIISSDGYIVTNCHVVESASEVSITTHSGDTYPAKVMGTDATNDVAVLKVDASDLPAVTLGSSADLRIGDMVVAIGNPLGELTATQTVGYVSGIDRQVTTDNTVINMIQTDAAINSGNSGGPLFNMDGKVVGITTAKYSGTTSSGASIEGISFAIPIDDVMPIISDLQNFGYVTGAYLGVTVQDMDPSAASMYGLPSGAYVAGVSDGGAAAKAGVQPKDIITKLGDYEIGGLTDLTRALRKFKAGDTITITVVRGGQENVLKITLDEKPQTPSVSPDQADGPTPNDGDFDEWYEYFRRYFGDDIFGGGNGNG